MPRTHSLLLEKLHCKVYTFLNHELSTKLGGWHVTFMRIMFMFSKQLVYDKRLTTKLFRINRYLSLFHTPAQTKARIGADAPMNDLQLIHDMMDYKEIDKEVTDVILLK